MALALPAPARLPVVTRHARRVALAAVAGFILFLLAGNAVIVAAWKWQAARANGAVPAVDVSNFHVVDDKVLRGAAPNEQVYRQLAALGVTTVVDLRAEDDLRVNEELLSDLGVRRVHIPMRDGQAPTPEQVDRFLAAVGSSEGRVYVHCGAGVGRTGTMVASYLVATGQANGEGAMRQNLAVGPPSLEQLAFASRLGADGNIPRVNKLLVAASRVLDAPRRIWVNVRA